MSNPFKRPGARRRHPERQLGFLQRIADARISYAGRGALSDAKPQAGWRGCLTILCSRSNAGGAMQNWIKTVVVAVSLALPGWCWRNRWSHWSTYRACAKTNGGLQPGGRPRRHR